MVFSYNICDKFLKIELQHTRANEFVTWHITFVILFDVFQSKNYVVSKYIMHCDVMSMIFPYHFKLNI